MLMNKQIYNRLVPLLLLVTVSMVVLAAGTENDANEPTAPTTDQPAQVSPEAGNEVPETAESEEKAPSEDAAAPRSIKEFKPTEKIEADSAVSFPIDI